MKPRLYLDLDGVMADFDGTFPACSGSTTATWRTMKCGRTSTRTRRSSGTCR